MSQLLFSPKKIQISDRLVLIPQFHDRDYFWEIKKKALKEFRLLGSEVVIFQYYTLITGFLGYPHLLTLLEFVEGVKEKQVFFLGTAGGLKPERDYPCSLNVTRIFPSSIFKLFSKQDHLDLLDLKSIQFEKAKVVSVDIIRRETRIWLKDQKRRRLDAVEMELFPLRVYMARPFYALVVLSDLVTEKGIKPFSDSKKFKTEFSRSFDFIDRFMAQDHLNT